MNLDPDPIKQFGLWYQAALDAGAQQPDAMALATSTRAGRPSNRLVLLKGWSERGFAFYTNLGSRKGQELAANPRAALAIYWREVGRQVRAAGRVSRLSRREAAAYWETRPVESQAAAWVSPQSRVIESREWLETMHSETLERLAGGRPGHHHGGRVDLAHIIVNRCQRQLHGRVDRADRIDDDRRSVDRRHNWQIAEVR